MSSGYRRKSGAEKRKERYGSNERDQKMFEKFLDWQAHF